MDNLNNIPNAGNWGDASSKLNDNFNKIKQAVTTVENTSKNNKGYFTSLSALNTAFPRPKAGQTAYVYGEASSTKYYIYNAVNGAWVTASIEAPSIAVDLSEYAKAKTVSKSKSELDGLKSKGLLEFETFLRSPGSPGSFETPSTDTKTTDYIQCSGIDKLKVVFPTWKNAIHTTGLAFYNKSKELMSFVPARNAQDNYGFEEKIIEVPENAYYFRTSYWNEIWSEANNFPDFYVYADNLLLELSNINNRVESFYSIPAIKNTAEPIQLGQGLITSNKAIGEVLTPVVEDFTKAHAGVIDVNEGDSFIITGRGGNSNRTFCILDKDNIVIKVSSVQYYMENELLIMPQGAKKFIYNLYKGVSGKRPSIKQVGLIDESVRDLEVSMYEPMPMLPGKAVVTFDADNLIAQITVMSAPDFVYNIFEVSAGDKFIINGTGGDTPLGFCILDENNFILAYSGLDREFENYKIVIPDGAVKMYCSLMTDSDYYVKKRNTRYLEDLGKDVSSATKITTAILDSAPKIPLENGSITLSNPVIGDKAVILGIWPDEEYFKHISIEVSEGEIYIINGKGGNNARLFWVTDETNTLIDLSGSYQEVEKLSYRIPEGGKRLTVNLNVVENTDSYVKSLGGGVISNNLPTLPPLAEFSKDMTLRTFDAIDERFDIDKPNFINTLYDAYDELVLSHPEYIERIDLADELGIPYPEYALGIADGHLDYKETASYKTYLYKFVEKDSNVDSGDNAKKKIFIACGLHGNEQVSSVTSFLFLEQLCKSFMDDDNLGSFRSSFDVYIIPCLNGYGVYHNQRVNANDVDLNRNFPLKGWEESGIGTSRYTGVSPASEFETKLVVGAYELISPHFMIDFHNFHDLSAQTFCDCFNTKTSRLIHQAYTNSSMAIIKNMPQYFGSKFKIFTDRPISPSPVDSGIATMSRWGAEVGCEFSSTFEVARLIQYTNGVKSNVSGSANSAELMSINEHFLREFLYRVGSGVLLDSE